MPPVRLFVGNLPYQATEDDLRTHFAQVGAANSNRPPARPGNRPRARICVRRIRRTQPPPKKRSRSSTASCSWAVRSPSARRAPARIAARAVRPRPGGYGGPRPGGFGGGWRLAAVGGGGGFGGPRPGGVRRRWWRLRGGGAPGARQRAPEGLRSSGAAEGQEEAVQEERRQAARPDSDQVHRPDVRPRRCTEDDDAIDITPDFMKHEDPDVEAPSAEATDARTASAGDRRRRRRRRRQRVTLRVVDAEARRRHPLQRRRAGRRRSVRGLRRELRHRGSQLLLRRPQARRARAGCACSITKSSPPARSASPTCRG